MPKKHGTIIAIGGNEDKEGDKKILTEVSKLIKGGKLVISAVASSQPAFLLRKYKQIFSGLGIKRVELLDIRDRAEALDEKLASVLSDAKGIFFTGGDQLRITSQIGDTPVYTKIVEIYEKGGLIIGTSAGASVMCSSMLTGGTEKDSPRAGGIKMAPGLGLLRDAIIDQHFAKRGRMGRLLCAIAENPRTLGIGIDEDTAIITENNETFRVIGEGAVYVIDGSAVTFSNLAEEEKDETISIHSVKLHVLSDGDEFDLEKRIPSRPGQKEVLPLGHKKTAKVIKERRTDKKQKA
jgi:cyanophycinase